jgi:hypothetical protein
MNDDAALSASKKPPLEEIMETVKKVILNPVEFYRGMPKVGGFVDPLVFAVVLGVVSGVIRAVLGLVHLGPAVSVMDALGAVIMVPVAVVIGGFIVAAILFVIWKLMESGESYETAYRCAAYAAAISPIMAVLGIIPYVGSLIGLAWGLYLVVTASVEVHKLPAQKAWMVFGILAAILALLLVNGERKAREMQRGIAGWQREYGTRSAKDMTPEEAGKAAAAMMKAMQEQAMREAAKAKAEAE